MFSRPQTCRYLALFVCVAVAGCAPLNKYSFETFNPQPAHAVPGLARSDLLALIYADYVARLLEGRSTGARVTRELSDSTLAVGGALIAAQETLTITAETVAKMGVGIVIVQQLQKIFNAGGRSEAFADAAYLIRQAQNEYRQHNPNPSAAYMTENGAILVSRVDGAVYAAQKTLTGRLPALLDLQQATQRMTEDGATRESSGRPRTIYTAAGDKPGEVSPEQVEAAIDRAASKFNRRQPSTGGQVRSQPVALSEFQNEVLALRGKLPEITGAPFEALWKKRYSTDYPGEEKAREILFADLTTFSQTSAQSDDTMSSTTLAVLAKWKKDIGP